ncbi:MAG: hypothetical protein IKF71_03635 [Bacilli bacterium]|nr:hypothetical protein [Bacilli bacterium]
MKKYQKDMKKKFKKIKKRIISYKKKHPQLCVYGCVFLIGILFSIWLVKHDMIIGDDLVFHISRIGGIKNSILNGDWKALIHNGLYGYGYATGLFYGNLLFYIPAIASILKLDLSNAYKLYVLLCSVGSALTMFWCIKGITKSNKAGLLGCFLYSGCSYKACDFIIRAAGGEMGAFVFLPLVILGFYYLVYDDYKKWWILSIGFFGIIQCHIISSVLLFCMIVIMLLINWERFWKEKERFLYLCISGIAGLLLTASFIFPMLEGLAKNSLRVDTYNKYNSIKWAIPFEKLFLGFPNYKTDAYNRIFYPPGIGILLIFLTSLRLKIKPKKEDKRIKLNDLCIIMGFGSLMCSTTLFPWEELEFLNKVQFPWRFYLFASVFLVVSSTIATHYYLEKKKLSEVLKFIIPVLLIATLPTILILYYYRNDTYDYYGWKEYFIAAGEYLPQATNVGSLKERGSIITSNKDNIKFHFKKNGNDIVLTYNHNDYKDENKTYLELPLLYYYGYAAIDQDGKPLKIEPGSNNIIRVYPDKEKGKIHVYYKGTPTQKISLWISILSWMILIGYLYINRKKNLS